MSASNASSWSIDASKTVMTESAERNQEREIRMEDNERFPLEF
jgi:hypothetical protein